MDNGVTYNEGDFQRSQDSEIENASNVVQLVEPPIAPTSGLSGSSDTSTKPRSGILPQISGILDSTAQVLFGVSSIKNGQNAQVPNGGQFGTNRTMELNQPPQRNNTLLFLGLAAVLVVAIILIFNKK